MATNKKFSVLYLLVLIVLATIFIFVWYKYLPEGNTQKTTSTTSGSKETPNGESQNQITETPTEIQLLTKDQQNYALGIDSINRGDYNQAIAYFDQAIKENPNEINYYSLKAQAELLAGQKADAVSTIESGLKIDPNNELLNSKLDVLNNENLSSPSQDNPRL